ncbi:MAG: hypothetical protein RLZZ299_2445 [Pseudomonadota bacterium]|jgi:hypothetical protein
MRVDDVVSCLFDIWVAAVEDGTVPQSAMLLGTPGVGKTSATRVLAARMTAWMRARGATRDAVCEVRDLTSTMPEDLGGLPFREGACTRYAPQAWLADACAEDAYGVLVLDDLPAASTAVQVASRQLALEHRVHDSALSPRVMVLVTGNRRQDRSAATTLPAHFRNSVLMLDIDVDLDAWMQWYTAQGLDPLVTRYLAFKPAHLGVGGHETVPDGPFPTPRSWAMLGRLLPLARRSGHMEELAAGLVGRGIAAELCAYEAAQAELPNPDDVLACPETAVPDPETTLESPDRMVALVTALAERTATHAANVTGPAPYTRYLRALAWVTAHGGRDYVSTSIAALLRAGGDMRRLQRALPALRRDEGVRSMLSAVAACFAEA